MLKRVSIQNFKSLKDVTLDLQKVNLLIGPNNSGKTNFLKALEFCGSIRNYQFEGEMGRYSEDEVLKYTTEQKFLFSRNTFQHEIENNIYIELAISNIENEKNIENRFRGSWSLEKQTIVTNPDDYTINTTGHLMSLLGELTIYKPDPSKFIKPVDLASDDFVDGDGSNVVSFLFNLGQNYKKKFVELEKDFEKCVGDLVSIGTPSVKTDNGNKLRLKFFDRNDNDYWADEVSEGVLYFLVLLCIINQPNPPKLLLLEEPEKGIHPRRIFEVIQFILQLAEDKDVQVIMTTHSPTVVDMFKDMPESVFIFDKDEEGATHVKNLQTDIIEPETEESKRLGIEPPHYTNSLGDAWTVGFLGGVPK